jgi:hypothetical protein
MILGFDAASLFSAQQQTRLRADASAAAAPESSDVRTREGGRDDYHGDSIRRRRHHHVHGHGQTYDRLGKLEARATTESEPTNTTQLAYRRTERTSLQITTQEGDVVELKFTAKDSLSAKASGCGEGDTPVAELAVCAKSSTRLMISVNGDINDAEYAAIQAVVDQASAVAADFFNGDVAAAFNSASTLGIDAGQLAQVHLRFSLRESLTYSGPLSLPASAPAAEAPAGDAPAVETTETATTQSATPDVGESQDPLPPIDTQTATDQADVTEATAAPAADASAATGYDALANLQNLLDTIAAFLTTVLARLETPAESTSVPATTEATVGDGSVRLTLDLSFKLRLLSTILVAGTSADETQTDTQTQSETPAVPALVPETLDALAAGTEPSLDAVA